MRSLRTKAERKGTPHSRKYKTLFIPPETVQKLDELKRRWRVNGRGTVITRLVDAYFHKQEKDDEVDIESRI